MNLSEQAETLRKEAFSIIEQLKLETLLKPIGKMQIVGSVHLNLMTWRDIDVHVFLPSRPNKEQSIEVAKELYINSYVRKITCIDYDNHRLSKSIANKPKGQYIGVEYVDDKENQWKVDLWLLDKANVGGDVMLPDDISEQNRIKILEIKSHFHSHPLYRNKITSVDIYQAVLKDGINSIEGFSNYLKQKGVEV